MRNYDNQDRVAPEIRHTLEGSELRGQTEPDCAKGLGAKMLSARVRSKFDPGGFEKV